MSSGKLGGAAAPDSGVLPKASESRRDQPSLVSSLSSDLTMCALVPQRVEGMDGRDACLVSCGDVHTVLLCGAGQLFTAGMNSEESEALQ